MLRYLAAIAAIILSVTMVFAQEERGPLFFFTDGLFSTQGDADVNGGGSFSVNRTFVRAGALYRFGDRASVGLFASRGWLDYDFGGGAAAPWSNVNDIALSVPVRYKTPSGVSLFASPSLRFDYEDGADQSEAETYGAFVGASWEVSERLSIGPAFGVFTQLASDSLNVFPALLIDWDISDQLNLSTGPTIGASQGPGLQLNYSLNDTFTFGLAGRYENARFRMSESGTTPSGVGEDESFPLVVTFSYAPNPGIGVSGFAGAELGGRLRVEDATGTVVDSRQYDAAPIVGAAIRLAF